MDAKQLKRLSREDLIELLLEEVKKNEKLVAELNDKNLKLDKVGSIAEASLAVNNVFTDAQKAADMYIENVKKIYEEAQITLQRIKSKEGNSNSGKE